MFAATLAQVSTYRIGGEAAPRTRVALLGVAMVCAFALFAAMPAVSSTSFLAKAAPGTAQAYQIGWDRDHAWVKIGRGEVVSGAASAACNAVTGRYAPPARVLCPAFASAAVRILGGSGGVWGEFYPLGLRLRYGTW